jgi:hypothetical protein
MIPFHMPKPIDDVNVKKYKKGCASGHERDMS